MQCVETLKIIYICFHGFILFRAPSDTIQGGTLQNLSPYQQVAILKCIDKVNFYSFLSFL